MKEMSVTENRPPKDIVESVGKPSASRSVWIGVTGILLAVIAQVFLEDHHLIGLVPAVLGLVVWSRQIQTPTSSRWPTPIVLTASCALVLAIHFWHIDLFPTGLFFDEAVNLREGLYLTNPLRLEPWSNAVSGRPTLFLYLIGFIQRIFGEHWMPVRYFIILVNLISVGVMAWAIRPLVGRSTALVASIIFGVSAYQVLFSRIIYEASISTVILLVAVGAAVRATRDEGFRWWLIWGTALGTGLWTYNAFRLVPIFFVIVLFGWAAATGYGFKKIAARVAIGAVVAFMIVSPMVPTVINNFSDFTLRAGELSVFREAHEAQSANPVIHNLVAYGLMFFSNPGTSDQMYQSPAFSPPTAVFLWIGLGLSIGAVVRRRSGSSLVMLFWLLAGLLPGFLTLSIEAPHWCRTLYALPAAATLAAVGLLGIADLSRGRRRDLLATGLLVAVIAGEIWVFHTRIENDRRYYDFFDPGPSHAAMLARQRVAEGRTVLASDEYATESYQEYVFWTIAGSETEGISAAQVWNNLPRPGSLQTTSVLISPRDQRLINFLLDLYPGSTLSVSHTPWGAEWNREVSIPSKIDAPIGRSAGLLIRQQGLYSFSGVEDLGLQLEGRDVRDGGIFVIPAGIWRVDCDRPCAETGLRISGPEDFLFRDALFNDPNAGHGLLATYRDSDGATSLQLDRLLFANQRGVPQPIFHIEWRGLLTVPNSGDHIFQLICNDHSLVRIDDEAILHYPLEEGVHKASTTIHLDQGDHSIQIEFAKLHGGLEFELMWKAPGRDNFEPLPLEFLTPESGPVAEDADGPDSPL